MKLKLFIYDLKNDGMAYLMIFGHGDKINLLIKGPEITNIVAMKKMYKFCCYCCFCFCQGFYYRAWDCQQATLQTFKLGQTLPAG